MYLHMGNGRTVRLTDILGIFDADSCTAAKRTKEYLKRHERDGTLENIKNEIPKSFVIETKDGREKVYFSPLSVKALCGRTEENL